MRDAALASYQKALLELFAGDLTDAERQERLRTDPAFQPYQDYIASFDPRCTEVASELVRKWSVRRLSSRARSSQAASEDP